MQCWAIDSMLDFLEDLQDNFLAPFLPMLQGGPFSEQSCPSWFSGFWDKVIPVIEARLEEHGQKFIAGTDTPTVADFKAFQSVIPCLETNTGIVRLPQHI